MKKALACITLIDFIFILFLSVSGMLGGTLGAVVYYLAFIIPAVIYFTFKNRLEIVSKPPRVTISGRDLGISFVMTAPSLALIFLVSYITSLLLSRFGKVVTVDVSGNLFVVMLTKAVLTPVLEEFLFRYIPISLLSSYSRRGTVLYSALFFALIHCNLYQLPYAFFAGVVFALLNLAADSILPSVILHILNNVISVLWLRFYENELFSSVYVIPLISAAVLSIPFFFVVRKRIREKILYIFTSDGKIPFSIESTVLAAVTLFVAFYQF